MFMRLLWSEMREGAEFREAARGAASCSTCLRDELGFELLCICLLSLWML